MATRPTRYLPPFARMRELWRNPPGRPQVPEPEPESSPEPGKRVRARTKKGTFKADDPATPEINEAYEEESPKPMWNNRMTKAKLLEVAVKMGIEDLTMDHLKKEILAALEKA